MKRYKHINQIEREQIFLYLNQGKSYRDIGKLLTRDHRSISREVNRNQTEGAYSAIKAHTLATKRRAHAKVGTRKLDYPGLAQYVRKRIGRGWSPEQIAGRLRVIQSQQTVSHETIYRFIYQQPQKRLRLYELLRRQHRRRQEQRGRKGNKRGMIANRVFIDQRPEIIDTRKEIGHWETDLMEGPRQTKGHVSVLLERKSRLLQLDKVKGKGANEKTDRIMQQLGKLPHKAVKSITYDNGKENAGHERVAKGLRCKTYFCNPYHSWEKGSVENSIGLVRQYLPKGMSLEGVSQGELSWIAWQLNNRPRKVLGYKTPSEIFYQDTKWVT